MKKKKYAYRILPSALVDFKDGKDWYRSQGVKGLSAKFNRAVLEAIERIQKTPFAYAVRYRDVRLCHTDIFPYAIHFIIEEPAQLITITAILY